MTENADKLLHEETGKGQNFGINKETVDYRRNIGKDYDLNTSQYYSTTRATIHYDNHGNVHIVPAMPNWMKIK